ncbi:class I SAM-dependent methyltransferase [Lachnoclostridium sp. Marseille-P6806]|uniref:class I SAM-dependent methyltransferase n=1 Tax=Lachnoclostridium sp. Marseille-P6806 TaxID=2364793 RepID=UPI002ECFE468
MNNGTITWYNLDLPDVIKLRDQIFSESGRVSSIDASALDPNWSKKVKSRNNILFIIEGLSMYLTAGENARMLSIIRENFDTATVIMECIAKMWVKRERVEKSIQQTGARFVFGADSFADIKDIARGYHKIKDDNILRGMRVLTPSLKLIDWLPIARKITQKILIFGKD